jgi:hypothetical protein
LLPVHGRCPSGKQSTYFPHRDSKGSQHLVNFRGILFREQMQYSWFHLFVVLGLSVLLNQPLYSSDEEDQVQNSNKPSPATQQTPPTENHPTGSFTHNRSDSGLHRSYPKHQSSFTNYSSTIKLQKIIRTHL